MRVFTVDLYEYFDMERGNANNGYLTCYVMERVQKAKGRGKFPAMLVIPGGAYWFVSEREGEPVVMRYLNAGFNCFLLNYSCGEGIHHPTQLKEAAMAMIYIRENADKLKIYCDCVSATGFSAGGHLCGMLATLFDDESLDVFGESKAFVRPEAVVLSYPVITGGVKGHHDSFVNLCGAENKELISYLSLEKRVTEESSPAFIWATYGDDLVPVKNSLLMADAYEENDVPFSLVIYEKGLHGLSRGDQLVFGTDNLPKASSKMPEWMDMAIAWLRDRGICLQDEG